MENLIVALIVGIAAFYTGRTFYRSFKGKSTCGCGCAECGVSDGCSEEKTHHGMLCWLMCAGRALARDGLAERHHAVSMGVPWPEEAQVSILESSHFLGPRPRWHHA